MATALATTAPQSYKSASQAAQAYIAAAFQSQQDLYLAIAVRKVLAIWQQLDLTKVRSSWPALRTAIEAVVRDGFAQSSAQAATYYASTRLAAEVPGTFAVAAAIQADQDTVTSILDATGPWTMLAGIKAAQPVQRAADVAGVRLSGAATRLISNGARQAVLTAVRDDAEAVGWLRVTSSDCCAFCAMLAGRGAVYKSEESASFDAHLHCQCVAQPVFSHADAHGLRNGDLARQWASATRGKSGADARRAWRQHWDSAHPDNPGVLAA